MQKAVACSTRNPLRTAQWELAWHMGVLLSLVSHMPESVTQIDHISIYGTSMQVIIQARKEKEHNKKFPLIIF